MKKLAFLMFAAVLFVSASVTFAQSRNVVVEPGSVPPQSFYVNVSVDHENRVYQEGELMTVTVNSNKPGYLYLFYTDASGHVTLLFPNAYHRDNYIQANTKVTVPNSGMNFKLRTAAPFGKEYLQAIVSLKPINVQSVSGFYGDKSLITFDNDELEGVKSLMEGYRGMIVEGIGNAGQPNNPVANREGMAEYTIEINTYARGQVPQTQKPRRFFVGIGLAKYNDQRIHSLPACEKDVIEMTRFFINSPRVNNNDISMFLNEKATKENIRKLFFEVLPNITKPGDEIIIFWTGHGGRCADTDGDETDRFDETLILYDSVATDPKTQLTDDEFGRWAQNLSARKVLFIIDTCHSGGLATNAKGIGGFRNVLSGNSLNDSSQPDSLSSFGSPLPFGNDDNSNKSVNNDPDYNFDFGLEESCSVKDLGQANLSVIASSAKTEPSLVMKDKNFSVMTWFILEELRSQSGINHSQLYERIKPKVDRYVKENFPSCPDGQKVSIQEGFAEPMIVNPVNP